MNALMIGYYENCICYSLSNILLPSKFYYTYLQTLVWKFGDIYKFKSGHFFVHNFSGRAHHNIIEMIFRSFILMIIVHQIW